MRRKILFLLSALSVQFAADFLFLYQQSRGLWYPGGISDYIYLVAYFLMAISILSFNAKDVLKKLELKNVPK